MSLSVLLWMCLFGLVLILFVAYIMLTKDAAIPHLQARLYGSSYLFMIHENKSVKPVMVGRQAVQKIKQYGVYQFSQETAYSYLGFPAFFANASGPAQSCSVDAYVAASKLKRYNIYPDRPFLENLQKAIKNAQDPSLQQSVFMEFFKATKTPGEWKKLKKEFSAKKAENEKKVKLYDIAVKQWIEKNEALDDDLKEPYPVEDLSDTQMPDDVYAWEFSKLTEEQQDDLITLAHQDYLLSGTDFSALHQFANLNNGAMIEAQINHQVNMRTRREHAGGITKMQGFIGLAILIFLACLGVYILTNGGGDAAQSAAESLGNAAGLIAQNLTTPTPTPTTPITDIIM